MKGDFSRDSFDPAKHFARVLLQQGRVLTDADFNEQGAIQRELLRSFVVDLVGRRWRVGEGFAIGGATADDFTIGAGRCWLGGLPFDNDATCRYRAQPVGPAPADEDGVPGRAFVVYLEGWERAVSAAEDPSLCDPALGGVDTSVRGQLVWRVRRLGAAAAQALAAPVAAALRARAAGGDGASRAALRALRAAADGFAADPGSCRRADALFDLLESATPALTVRTVPPGGPPGGTPGSGEEDAGGYVGLENRLYRVEIGAPGTAGAATFRWSRDNGATAPAENEAPVVERTAAAERWIALEDGIEIQFAANGCYNSGDYWTVPARPAIRGVLWPTEADGVTPRALPPRGLCLQRAALAAVRKSGRSWRVTNYRPRRG